MFPIISNQPNQTFAIKLFFLGSFQFLMLLVKVFCLSCKILRIRMERRIDTEAIHARGIFPGAQVVRGHDWDWKLFWNSDKYNMLVGEQCQLAVHISREVGEKALINWVMMERWVINILLKRQFSGKNHIKDDHQVKDHWIRDQGFVLILLISVSGPNALCNHNCSICPQCSKACSINSQCRITEFELAYNK